MANEIRATATLQITQNGFVITGNTTNTISMTGSNYGGQVVTISSSYVPIPTGSCSSMRYLFLTNNSTASVNVAVHQNSSSFATLQYLDTFLVPPSPFTGSWYIKSDTGGTDVQVVVVEP